MSLCSPMLSPSASAGSLSPSTPALSAASSTTSMSSISVASQRSGRNDAFFSFPPRSVSPSPPSKIDPKSHQMPLSRLFPSRQYTDPTSLPTPQESRRRLPSLENNKVEGTPALSLVIPDTSNESTPRPRAHEPSFLTSQPDPSIVPGGIITSPHSRASSTAPVHSPGFLSPRQVEGSDNSHVGETTNVRIELIRSLGQGAFSNVWLGRDLSDRPLKPLCRTRSKRARQAKASGGYLSVRGTGGGINGTTPCRSIVKGREGRSSGSDTDAESVDLKPKRSRLVAVKLTPKARDGDQDFGNRTLVSFIREVEILEHISHPYITPLLGSFTTATHHALVLPYLQGQDLLALVNSDRHHAQLTETTLQTIWRQLCSAVSWMHSVGLVHRDIKLENILLALPFPFADDLPSHVPLIKLTDFGLSRFIDMSSPLLTTRCGSEAYAAPELVMRGGRYDGRETDAWACGAVLYSLACRRLPFGDVNSIIGREQENAGLERRSWLMRIANGVWRWPEDNAPDGVDWLELRGRGLVQCQGARRIVERLLVRNPKKRARIADLWDDPWSAPIIAPQPTVFAPAVAIDDQLDDDEETEDLEAELVDRESIKTIASQEVPGLS